MNVLKQKIEALSGQEYMSADQVAVFREALIEEKRRLLQSSQLSKSEGVAAFGEHLADPADKSTRETETELRSALEQQRSLRIKQIDAAFIAIRNDEYGFCKECGDEIGLARLVNNPATLMDVSCSTLDEIKTKQMTGAY